MLHAIKQYQIPVYLIIVLIVSWIPWFLGAGSTLTAFPSAFAILFVFFVNGRGAGIDLLRRALRWRRGVHWWLIAVFGVAIIYLIGVAIFAVAGGDAPEWVALRDEIDLLPLFFLFILLPVFGPVGEEIGWRGYLQGHLQPRIGPLWTSLLIGFYWGFWHLPDFVIEDTIQSNLGMVFFVPFIFSTIANSFVMTWLYNRTNSSTLLAGILWHAGIDFWGPLLLTDFSLRAAQDAQEAGEAAPVPDVDATLYAITLAVFVVVGLVIGWRTNWRFGYTGAAN